MSAFDPLNLILIEDDGAGTRNLTERTTAGTLVQTIESYASPATVSGIGIDVAGRLYACETDGATLSLRRWLADGTDDGVFIDLSGLGGLGWAPLHGIDTSGNVYIQDSGESLHKYDASGAFVQTFTPPIDAFATYGRVNPAGTRYYYSDFFNFGDDAVIRAFDLTTETDLGAVLTITEPGPAGILPLVHASGDVLGYYDREEVVPTFGEVYLTRVTTGGGVVGTHTIDDTETLRPWGGAALLGDANLVYLTTRNPATGVSQVWRLNLTSGALDELFTLSAELPELAHWFVQGCQPVLLLGSDTGNGYRDVGLSDSYLLAHEMSDGGSGAYASGLQQISVDPSDMRRVAILGWNALKIVNSSDGGASWTEQAHAETLDMFSPLTRDEATGDLYAKESGTDRILKSTDNGTSWSEFIADAGASLKSICAQDGHLYYVRNLGGSPAVAEVRRVLHDGSGDELVWTGADLDDTAPFLQGGYASGLIFLTPNGVGATVVNEDPVPYVRIATVGPTATVLGFTDLALFSAEDAEAPPLLRRILPLSSTRCLLFAVANGFDTAGVWLSTDGGATWTNVLFSATEFTYTGITSVSPDTLLARDDSNVQRVALAASAPGYYLSLNAGATWELKTVTPQGANGDNYWLGIGWASTCADGGGGGEEPEPVVRRRRSFALFIGKYLAPILAPLAGYLSCART